MDSKIFICFIFIFGFLSAESSRAQQSVSAAGCQIPVYAGVDINNIQIPRKGLINPLLKYNFGVNVEPVGKTTFYKGCQFVKGPVSSFGGPSDTTISRKEVGALTGELLRFLNNPENPPVDELSAQPEKYYYAAMRIRYSSKNIDQWQAAKILVVNPKNGIIISLRMVDWGPGPSGGRRIIDLSPQSLHDLGLQTDEEPYVAFGTPEVPLGIVQRPKDL